MTENQWIYAVVDSFYQKARHDVLIGYHFRNIENFDEHIPRIATFWELQLLGKASRPVDPPFDVMKIHMPLGIKRGELGRWLVLFRDSLKFETKLHPEMHQLKDLWEQKLIDFEARFLRFFSF